MSTPLPPPVPSGILARLEPLDWIVLAAALVSVVLIVREAMGVLTPPEE